MGEATYYGVVTFESVELAEQRGPVVEEFLTWVARAWDHFQNLRENKTLEEAKQSEATLRADFAELFKMMELPPIDWEHGAITVTYGPRTGEKMYDLALNYYAGKLDAPDFNDDGEIIIDYEEVRFSGTVWHFANWEVFRPAILKIPGVLSFSWISDEHIVNDYYDLARRASN